MTPTDFVYPADIGKVLTSLTNQEFLSRNSKGRWTTYRLKTDFELSKTDQEKTDQEKSFSRDNEHTSRRKLKKQMRLEQILAFCAEPKSLYDIMQFCSQKSRVWFKQQYIDPLLEENLLKMSNPQTPTDRGQKYVATGSKRK